jgi:hypothetical protein
VEHGTVLQSAILDVLSNTSSTNSNTYTWDLSAPVVSIVSGPTGSVDTNAAFSLQLNTTEAFGYWSTNSIDWYGFSGTTAFINIELSTPYFLYYGLDQYGNLSDTISNNYSWDTGAPVVTITSGPSGDVTTNTVFSVTLTTTEEYGYWSTNGTLWSSFNPSTNFIIAVGTPYLKYYGLDSSGNNSGTNESIYGWDLSAPYVGISAGPVSDITTNIAFSVTLTNSEEFGYYTTNGSDWYQFNPGVTLSVVIGTPYLRFYGADAYGNMSSTNEVVYTWDLNAPTVTVSSGPAADYTTNDIFNVTLDTTEANGYWSTNGSGWTSFAVSDTIAIVNGITNLRFFGRDSFGNVSLTNINAYSWDYTAPVVSVASGPSGDYTTNKVFDVTLTNDEAFGFYSTNGSLWSQFDPSVTISVKLYTPYLMYYGRDVYGNTSGTNSNAYTWDIDFPVVTISNGPTGDYTTNTAFELDFYTSKSNGYWSTNGVDWSGFSDSSSVIITFDTSYLLYYGRDIIDNYSPTNSNAYVWDTNAPAVSVVSGPVGDYTTNQVFSMTLSNDEANGYWSTNSGGIWNGFNGAEVINIAVSTGSLMHYGRDVYGNVSGTTTYLYTWDTNPPAIGVSSGPVGDYTTNDVFSITLTNSDGTGYWTTNSFVGWVPFTSNAVVNIALDTPSLQFRAVDDLGNVTAITTYNYTWATAAPVVTIVSGPTGDYFTNNNSFVVGFSVNLPDGYWSTNGTDWASFTAAASVTIVPDTEYMLYYGKDAFNNVSAVSSNGYIWDVTPPLIGIAGGPTGSISTNEGFTITLTNSDGTGYWTTNSSYGWFSFTTNVVIQIPFGTPSLQFRAIDDNGNPTGITTFSYTWITPSVKETIVSDGVAAVSPKYIFVNNGGNELAVEYTADSDKDTAVLIYNYQGFVVKRIETPAGVTGSHVMSWDGTDEYGNRLLGIYFIVIEVGGKAEVSKKTKIVCVSFDK